MNNTAEMLRLNDKILDALIQKYFMKSCLLKYCDTYCAWSLYTFPENVTFNQIA